MLANLPRIIMYKGVRCWREEIEWDSDDGEEEQDEVPQNTSKY